MQEVTWQSETTCMYRGHKGTVKYRPDIAEMFGDITIPYYVIVSDVCCAVQWHKTEEEAKAYVIATIDKLEDTDK